MNKNLTGTDDPNIPSDVYNPKLDYIRPKDAATLIIVRNGVDVLMGVRSAKHAFMPNKFVFPGGRVDTADGRVARPVDLHPVVATKLERGCAPFRARALAMAAVRETFEEAGLILGVPTTETIRTKSPGWKPFFDAGYAPALDQMEYVSRAITPPGRPRRFDARFFMVNADKLHGSIDGNGELENLHWVPIEEAQQLDLPNVTSFMIDIVKQRLKDRQHMEPGASIPFSHWTPKGFIRGDEH
jgi:8-oxo-dGTP pyrophosphatase MutT (NUDIX family)